jgi:hypothetical protein
VPARHELGHHQAGLCLGTRLPGRTAAGGPVPRPAGAPYRGPPTPPCLCVPGTAPTRIARPPGPAESLLLPPAVSGPAPMHRSRPWPRGPAAAASAANGAGRDSVDRRATLTLAAAHPLLGAPAGRSWSTGAPPAIGHRWPDLTASSPARPRGRRRARFGPAGRARAPGEVRMRPGFPRRQHRVELLLESL